MARNIVKQDKYQYLKEGNKVYRYPYVAEVKDYDYIGEEYDSTHSKWRKSSATMAVKMSGHGVVIARPSASVLVAKTKKTSIKR